MTRFFFHTEIPADGRPELFIRKLHQCSVLFDFNDASAELKGKQIKAQALHEMLDYVTTQRGVITENIYPEVINMVSYLRQYLNRILRISIVLHQFVSLYTASSESHG